MWLVESLKPLPNARRPPPQIPVNHRLQWPHEPVEANLRRRRRVLIRPAKPQMLLVARLPYHLKLNRRWQLKLLRLPNQDRASRRSKQNLVPWPFHNRQRAQLGDDNLEI